MEIYKTSERDEERFHSVCDHCGKIVYPSHKNDSIFHGFLCLDTKMFISNDCKKDYYNQKNKGLYGAQHSNKYSETPVQVPWINKPKKELLFIPSVINPKTSQLKLQL